MALKVGDIVRFLNAVGGGRVTRISDNIAYVDEDGFETPVLVRECVVIEAATPTRSKNTSTVTSTPPKSKEVPVASTVAAIPTVEKHNDVVELPNGDDLNIVIGFEPSNIKQLSTTTFDSYLVNDSNYFLYVSFLTRANDSRVWMSRFDGIVEPNMQVFLAEICHADLPNMDRIAVQYIAFKRQRDFELKAPASVELKLDTTKFAKLHCFQKNMYFDAPVIALDITRRNIACRQMLIDTDELENAMRQKKAVDTIKSGHNEPKQKPDIIEIDLHASELLENTSGLSNADILNAQIDRFSEVMNANLKNIGQKIVFIHGKGEGVLRQAIMKELTHRYKGHDVQDASFREYGFGATQVTIRQTQSTVNRPISKKKNKR